MSKVHLVNQRYENSASLVQNGVAIIAVSDPPGSRLLAVVKVLLEATRNDGPEIWDDLLGAARALLWRRVTQPQPVRPGSAIQKGAEEVLRQASRILGAVASSALLDELSAAAEGVAQSDSYVGDILWRSLEEVGFDGCVVVAASKPAQAGIRQWLVDTGIAVLTTGELAGELNLDQAYVVGAPRLFKPSLVTSPMASEVTFLMPAWISDRSVPHSAMADVAERALLIRARIFEEQGSRGPEKPEMPEMPEPEADGGFDFLPQPIWGAKQAPDREPASHEVQAHKVLLSGNQAAWLDDGERIRALDPSQPVGERVLYTEVSAVRVGTYLLLRKGDSEHGALYESALKLMGVHGRDVDVSQRHWKHCLSQRILERGFRDVVSELKAKGVKTAERARAWTDPNLVRPHSDRDFEKLLEWLDIEVQPTFSQATRLRRALYQASANLREELENRVSEADLTILELDGQLSLDLPTAGLRGITATRVLAISPFAQIVPRHLARVLFEDRSGQWLE